MSLLIFCYILAAFLFFFSYWLDSRSEKSDAAFTGITLASAFVALFAGLAITLVYTRNYRLSTLSLRCCLIAFAYVTLSLVKFSTTIPYKSKHPVLNAFLTIFTLFSGFLVFTTVEAIQQTAYGTFTLKTIPFYGFMDGLALYVALFIVAAPALAVLIMVMRAIGVRSRIYRQRILFIAASVCVGFVVSFLFYKLSSLYGWALPLVPFGLAVMLMLIYQSLSVTTLLDRTQVFANVVNFALMSLAVSLSVGAITALTYEALNDYASAFVSLIVIVVAFLVLRYKISQWIRRFIRVGSDYEKEMEDGLEAIDYTAGSDPVIKKLVGLFDQYVESSEIEIMVSDDKTKLQTVYSGQNAKHELAIDNKALDFLLGRNESIVLKTQAITNHVYTDVKADLLKIFDIVHADAFILIREGHRVVGIILLGPKKHGSDYTEYDYTVLSRLYSHFFLVMYYLKNIANEAVVLTVDREIEFSGQIITSIQENIDRINHEKVDADFITRSARKLGGDFIDFIKLGNDKYLYVMGDVSGKGLNASMSMVILKSVLRTFLTETSDFKKLVVKVNHFIKNNLPKGTFFAGVFGLMDFSTNTMYYINCGVPAMMLYTAAYNNAIEIQGDGKVLGFVKDVTKYLKVKKIVLNPQDIILMTTDGLVDSTNLRGERFGKDRVQRLLLDNRSYPAGRMAQFLCDNLSDFVSRELEDDITVLVFKYLAR